MSSKTKRPRVVHNDSMEVDSDGDDLCEKHQLLLSYLMHQRMAKKIDLIKVHSKIFEDDESLSDTLSTITGKINSLKMDIKQVTCDITGQTYYVMIHTAGESFFPRCSIFSKDQSEFLKQVLDGVVLSSVGFVGKIQALNSCKGMSKSDAEQAIRLYVQEKLLIEENGKLFMSPLAIVEFEPYFNSCLSGNLATCDLCKQLVFLGYNCDGCEEKFHRHCVAKWNNNKHTECPKCNHRW